MTASPQLNTDNGEGAGKSPEDKTGVPPCTEDTSGKSKMPPVPDLPAKVEPYGATTILAIAAISDTDTTQGQTNPPTAAPVLPAPADGTPTPATPTQDRSTQDSPTQDSPTQDSPTQGGHNDAIVYLVAPPSKATHETYNANNPAEALTGVTSTAATQALATAAAPPANPTVAASAGPLAIAENAAPPPKVASSETKSVLWPHSTILAKAQLAETTVMEWIRDHGKQYGELQFAYNYLPHNDAPKVHIVRPEEGNSIWFIGDVHGDILALDAALDYIDTRSGPKPTIIFLGDLFDRFVYGKEVLMRVLDLIISRPGKIMWLAGNHDDALAYKDGQFSSNSRPDEFAQWLNANQEKYADFGRWLIGLCQLLPRALFFDDGLCVVHGGSPSFDMSKGRYLIDDIKDRQELEQKDILHAFVWNRVIPNQLDKSQDEVGKNDLIHFYQHLSKRLGIPVKRMLRGHDHCRETRFAHYDFYQPEAPVLTMVTMSAWYLGSKSSAPELVKSMRKEEITTPAIAKYRQNDLPEVYTLQIPHEVVAQFHQLESLD